MAAETLKSDQLKKLPKNKAQKALQLLNQQVDGGRFDPETAHIMAQNMSFYPNYMFLDVSEHTSHPPRKIFALLRLTSNDNTQQNTQSDDIRILNWTNEAIYALNETLPIHLSEDNIRDYVRFFFTYVRGRHGRFLVTETVDDIQWREEPPPAARKAVGKMIEPIKIIGSDDEGNYHLRACVMFKDSLFKARVTINKLGVVDITEEELVIEDMPVFDDTLGQ